MEEQKSLSTSQTINLVIGLAAFIVVFFLIIQVVNKALRNQAVDQCSRVSKFEKQIKDENAKVMYPLNEVYKNCLKDKGY